MFKNVTFAFAYFHTTSDFSLKLKLILHLANSLQILNSKQKKT